MATPMRHFLVFYVSNTGHHCRHLLDYPFFPGPQALQMELRRVERQIPTVTGITEVDKETAKNWRGLPREEHNYPGDFACTIL